MPDAPRDPDPTAATDGASERSATLPVAPDDASADVGTVDLPRAVEATPQAAPAETVGYAPRIEPVPVGMVRVADHEILGVLGRGATGVVYQARQPVLKRLVALKMILAGSHANSTEAARFRVEAEAVARLRHPNIVQIYAVGEEDGRPYLALEYVEGGNLARHINGAPQPPRTAAELAVVFADAIAYAHQQGIIHRDLKPSNILLALSDGQPSSGARLGGSVALTVEGAAKTAIPKISDFGLAKRLQDDASETRSGTIIGTPSYMAPEQAAGRVRDLGPLSDVYSLGAILYELLTGRAPFRAESVVATLELVRTQEPVPPTQLQPGVPRDLETICLKCLQKEPAKRYAGAVALADDLRRFLAGEPIRARPVSARERLWRWCRRNPRLAILSGAVALLLVVIAVVSSTMAWRINEEKYEADLARDAARDSAVIAEQQKQDAEVARDQARDSAAVAAKQKRDAEVSRDLARRAAVEANRNAEIAKEGQRQAMMRMVQLVEKLERRLHADPSGNKPTPEIRALRDGCLDMLKDAMLQMSRDFAKTGVTLFSQVVAYQQLGDLLGRLNLRTEATQQYRLACDVLRGIIAEHPESDVARANLALMLERLADSTLELTGDLHEARDRYLESRRLQQDIADHPRQKSYTPVDNKRLMSHYDLKAGTAYLRLGDPRTARKYFQECLEFRHAWVKADPVRASPLSFLSQAHFMLADASWRLGDNEAAHTHYHEATDICKRLTREVARDLSFRVDLAEVSGGHGDLYLRLGATERATENYQLALEQLEFIVVKDPDDTSRLPVLGLTRYRLGLAALGAGKRKDAEAHFRAALAVRQELADAQPWNVARQMVLAINLARCGRRDDAVKHAEALRQRSARNGELLVQLAACSAVCAEHADGAQRVTFTTQAIADLRQALADGYRDGLALGTDPDLQALRSEAPFQALLHGLK